MTESKRITLELAPDEFDTILDAIERAKTVTSDEYLSENPRDPEIRRESERYARLEVKLLPIKYSMV